MSKDYKKLYEEALERAKYLKENTDCVRALDISACFEYIFPELRESEDEKIRKRLIEFISCNLGAIEDLDEERALAWLEKQGEQKPAEWDILSAKKGDMLSDGNIVLIVDSIEEFEGRPIINSWYFADSKKFYGKGTSECDRWEVDGFRTATEAECNYLLKMMSDAGYVWNTNKLELMEIEQNPAWSEEDENGLGDALWAIQQARTIAKDENDMGNVWYAENWLKSLKDRVQSQYKQEWSEEDEKMKSLIISTLTSMGTLYLERYHHMNLDEVKKWLKSLKPQSHWKPSEEQLRAIINSAQGLYQCKEKEVLLDLYEQLKKL